MSSLGNLAKGAGVYIISSIINAAVPFLLLPVLTRYLSPAEYGEVALFNVWVSLAGALCGLSVHAAANRKYFDYKDKQNEMGEFIVACLTILAISSAILFVVTLIFANPLSELLNFPVKWLLLGIPFAAANFVIQIRLGQWQVREKPIVFGIFQVSQSLLNVGLSLLLVIIFTLGVTGRIAGYSAAVFSFSLIALLFLYRDRLLTFTWRPDLIKEALRFGVPLVPHIIGAFLLLSIDRAVISALLGTDAAGIYMVALQVGLVASLLLDAINKAFSPWLFKNLTDSSAERKVSVVKVTYGLYALLVVGAGLGFLIGDDILLLLVGPDFTAAADVVGWVILGQALRGAYLFVTNYIFYTKRTGVIAVITITSGIINTILLFVMLELHGVVGAAYALCISMTIQWLATWIIAQRLVRMPWAFYLKKNIP
ncbi:oligosaccharide flippase family protein [Pseudidiomarina sp.]|uniref:oligosaccharide flippase family protein n=1 Tax=Pseudidiomarina sp. TaxID=2081707 RepID=UPI003A97B2EB